MADPGETARSRQFHFRLARVLQQAEERAEVRTPSVSLVSVERELVREFDRAGKNLRGEFNQPFGLRCATGDVDRSGEVGQNGALCKSSRMISKISACRACMIVLSEAR